MSASEASNRSALEKMVAHHRTMVLELGARVDALVEAAEAGEGAEEARLATLDYLRAELLPHAAAEEETIYAAAPEPARLLVRSMILEHGRLVAGVGDLESTPDGIRATATARALEWLFEIHARKENELLLPALSDSGADLSALLGSMHEALERAHEQGPETTIG